MLNFLLIYLTLFKRKVKNNKVFTFKAGYANEYNCEKVYDYIHQG